MGDELDNTVELAPVARAKLPFRWIHAARQCLKDGACKKTICGYIDDIHKNIQAANGLFLFGDLSTDYCAGILLKAAIAKGHTALWLEAGDVPSSEIESPEFEPGTTVMQRAKEVDLLIVSGLALEHNSNYASATLLKLIRSRFASRKACIITSPLSPSNSSDRELISRRYGASMVEILRKSVTPVRCKEVVDGEF